MILKTNRLKLATILMATALVLTGCGNQTSTTKKATSQKTTTTAVKHKTHTKKTSATKKETALWDNKKDAQLKTFIDQWAPKMNQSYTKYDGTHPLKTSVGETYPDYLSQVNVEGAKTSIGFSKDGKGNYSYNVVAIYNYDGTKPPLPNHITYFFAFHEGQPIVLVDQSRDGTANLVETQNNDVKSAFNEIVNGQSASDSSSQAATTTKSNSSTELTRDPKMIGVMVYQLTGATNLEQLGDMLGVYTASGKYWIGTGTSASNVGYTIEGDTVHYFTKDYSDGSTTADAKLIDHPVSLQDLEAQYYSTADQKQTVQSVANQMPAIEAE